MPSKCNHEKATTRFCPHCGELVCDTVGYAMIAHCRQTLKTHQSTHDNLKLRIDHNSGDSLNGEETRQLCLAAEKVEKWTAWTAWVQKQVELEELEVATSRSNALLTYVATWLNGWIQNEKKPQDMDFANLEDRIHEHLGHAPIEPFSFLQEKH